VVQGPFGLPASLPHEAIARPSFPSQISQMAIRCWGTTGENWVDIIAFRSDGRFRP
jgi:hypothetical protein